jgi:uncharacterized protein YoxC
VRKPRRELEVFSLSFLDVICCGFGAVILLLVISLGFEPTTVENVASDLRQDLQAKEQSRAELIAESQTMARDLAAKRSALSNLAAQAAQLEQALQTVQSRAGSVQAREQEQLKVEQQLKQVSQNLSAEMERLLNQPDYKPPTAQAVIGGIPVDSEYIIFIIDTSDSMKRGAWPLAIKKVEEVLNVYPHVKGIQVLSDIGNYMFESYRGQWIPDSPARRKMILERMKTWVSFSKSSPVEGVLHAVKTFYDPNRPTSIFIFGDDFNGQNIEEVVRAVAQINRRSGSGQTNMRIHAFGFPVMAMLVKGNTSYIRFAHLMRVLAEQNSGSFVALNNYE